VVERKIEETELTIEELRELLDDLPRILRELSDEVAKPGVA